MKLEVDMDSQRFNSALKQLVKITGLSQDKVIKSEFRAMLGKAMKDTNPADKKKIRAYFDFKGEGQLQPDAVKGRVMVDGKLIYTRQVHKKGMWVKRKKGNYWSPDKINPKYKKVKEIFAKQMKYALSQVGQTKATWVWFAKKMDLKGSKLGREKIPAYVSSVTLPRRLVQKLSVKEGQPLEYFIEINHSGATANAPGTGSNPGTNARVAMFSAFQGRKLFYEKNVSKGVFESTQKALKAYPEIRIALES